MNTRPSTPWARLVSAARSAPLSVVAAMPGSEDNAAPLGFSARVVANARITSNPSYGAVFERLAARAFGLAGACALAMIVWSSLPVSAEAKSADLGSDLFDPVGEVLTSTQS